MLLTISFLFLDSLAMAHIIKRINTPFWLHCYPTSTIDVSAEHYEGMVQPGL